MLFVDEDVFEGCFFCIELDIFVVIVEVVIFECYVDFIGFFIISVYLEVDYKFDVLVIFGIIGFDNVGIIGNGQVIFFFGFNVFGEWKKIYFNFFVVVVEFGFDEY